MQKTKIETYIGFAIKSNAVQWGIDNITLKKARANIIILDYSLSDNSAKKIRNYALRNNIEIIEIDNLPALCGRQGTKAIGICDKNLATAIKKVIEGV